MTRKRWIWGAALLALLAGVATLGWAMRDQIAYARIATGYAAKQTCSCVHVSGRTLESCLAEFPEDARGQINVTSVGNETRASVLGGVISSRARYADGYGCEVLE